MSTSVTDNSPVWITWVPTVSPSSSDTALIITSSTFGLSLTGLTVTLKDWEAVALPSFTVNVIVSVPL